MSDDALAPGYHAVGPGMLVNAVTFLEMRARPDRVPRAAPDGLSVDLWQEPDAEAYLDLFRAVGSDWLWTSRLAMGLDRLRAHLRTSGIDVYRLRRGQASLGLLELDFRVSGECEIVYFGLVPDAIGQGAGRFLIETGIARAWEKPISRLWLHTCNFDHPAALGFYRRSGFTPYKMMAEVMEDPRLKGLLPRTAAPHVPIYG